MAEPLAALVVVVVALVVVEEALVVVVDAVLLILLVLLVDARPLVDLGRRGGQLLDSLLDRGLGGGEVGLVDLWPRAGRTLAGYRELLWREVACVRVAGWMGRGVLWAGWTGVRKVWGEEKSRGLRSSDRPACRIKIAPIAEPSPGVKAGAGGAAA